MPCLEISHRCLMHDGSEEHYTTTRPRRGGEVLVGNLIVITSPGFHDRLATAQHGWPKDGWRRSRNRRRAGPATTMKAQRAGD
ncbi:hypothetical protein MRB53_036985 [Persea americana]|nr:hypothetical protein MRB53_036985 [Persea americana]